MLLLKIIVPILVIESLECSKTSDSTQYLKYCECEKDGNGIVGDPCVLLCTGKELKNIPVTVPPSTYIIQISDSSVSSASIPKNLTSNNLDRLIIRSSQISTVKAPNLNLNKLGVLDLGKNPIQLIDFSSGVDNLQILRLDHAGLKNFDASLYHIPKLFHLKLSNNPIKHLNLNGLKLEKLELNNVGLVCFDVTNDLDNCDLKTAKLANNKLKTFQSSRKLQEIDIRGNHDISRIKFSTLPRELRADDYSLPCDCCILKQFTSLFFT